MRGVVFKLVARRYGPFGLWLCRVLHQAHFGDFYYTSNVRIGPARSLGRAKRALRRELEGLLCGGCYPQRLVLLEARRRLRGQLVLESGRYKYEGGVWSFT